MPMSKKNETALLTAGGIAAVVATGSLIAWYALEHPSNAFSGQNLGSVSVSVEQRYVRGFAQEVDSDPLLAFAANIGLLQATSLKASTVTKPVGGVATFVATCLDQNGNPIAGVPVNLVNSSGAVVAPFTTVSNSYGAATLSNWGVPSTAGTYSYSASATYNGKTITSSAVTIIVQQTLTVSVSPSSVEVNEAFTATVNGGASGDLWNVTVLQQGGAGWETYTHGTFSGTSATATFASGVPDAGTYVVTATDGTTGASATTTLTVAAAALTGVTISVA